MAQPMAIADIAAKVNAGQLKASDLVKEALAAANEKQDYQALISTLDGRALERADVIDQKVAAGQNAGALAGVPFIAKDNFLTLGGKSTAAANYLKNYEAPYQATVIERLEDAGAICVGKANLDAWAHGSSTENSDFFVSKHPLDKSRVPGGSSGGSALAVALDIAPFALGTETGGSVRLPAAFCGVVGYKPTYGLVSRSGIVAMASSTDVAGPMARSVEDIAIVLDVMSGRDELDGTTIDKDPKGYSTVEPLELKGLKIGLVKEYMSESMSPGVRSVMDESIGKLKNAGVVISEVSLPSMPLALAIYYIVCPAEVSSNLARYDGQRYGHSAAEAKGLEDSYLLSREQGFGAEAKRRIMIGTHVLSSGYHDAYYKKAQTVRTKLINEVHEAFKNVDFMLGPTSGSVAFKIGERSKDPLQMYLSDLFTVGSNITGIPAITVPAGDADGLPVGLQLIAPMRADRQLLAVSRAFEGVVG